MKLRSAGYLHVMRQGTPGGIRRAMTAIGQKSPFKLRLRLGRIIPDTYDSDYFVAYIEFR